MAYLGVDLGGTNIKAALVTEEGKILREASVPTALPRSSEAVCDDIVKLCTELASGGVGGSNRCRLPWFGGSWPGALF